MKKRYAAGLLLATGLCAFGQTKVNLGAQGQDIDFSQAPSVRPFPTGTTLPASCSLGQMYFLTVAPIGPYECVGVNSWNPVQGGGGTSSSSPNSVPAVQLTSSTQLTIGPSCSVNSPCVYRIGFSVYSIQAAATATVTGSGGLTYIYIDASGNLTVGVSTLGSPAVTCAGCIIVQGITGYPPSSIPLESWNATSGVWDAAGASATALLSVAPALVSGSNIVLTQSPGSVTISAAALSPATSGSSGPYFNPTDPTQWYRDELTAISGFNKGTNGWSYSDCGGGTSASPGLSAESVMTGNWAQASGANATCFYFFPFGSTTFDFWSGATPASLWMQATYQSTDTNGTQYVGLANGYSDGPPQDFIGCRQAGAGDWFAVIRAGGADLATADTTIPHDTAVHRVVVDNHSGAANQIRCSVDGAPAAAAAAAVPVETYGWYYVAGAMSSGPATNFTMFEHTIFLQQLPRQ